MSSLIIENRKARFEYEIYEVFEAGVCLLGCEVKSIREKNVGFSDAFVALKSGEPYILNMKITKYSKNYPTENPEPDRDRKILLHKKQIHRIFGKMSEKGYTVIPLNLHLKNGKVKVDIALAKGKTLYDKRQTIKARDLKRDAKRNKDD